MKATAAPRPLLLVALASALAAGCDPTGAGAPPDAPGNVRPAGDASAIVERPEPREVALATDVDAGDASGQADVPVNQPTRDDGSPPAQPSCRADVVDVAGEITESTHWPCAIYRLRTLVYVTRNAVLSIEPGTTVLGDALSEGGAGLVVTRGARLVAVGTRERPIVFTSSRPVGQRRAGDWAGVTLLGGATINTGIACASGAGGCLESGLPWQTPTDTRSRYGGLDDAGSCGHLELVRIEFSGREFPVEASGLTVAGCGSGTRLSHIQVHGGSDDGIELLGGTASLDRVLLSANHDDGLDWDGGWRGTAQFLVVQQLAAIGDNGIEGSGSSVLGGETAEPRSAPLLYNVTLLGRPLSGRAVALREGSRAVMRNFIVQGFAGDVLDLVTLEIDLAQEWPAHIALEHGLFWMNGALGAEIGPADDDRGFDEKAALEDPARRNRFDAVDPMLTKVFPGLSGAGLETTNYVPRNAEVARGGAVPPFGDRNATYLGAFAPNDDSPWTGGWTAFPEH